MTLGEMLSVIALVIGGLGAFVTFILFPANRKKLLAETENQIATAEKQRIEAQKSLQEQITSLVTEQERLHEMRQRDYDSREKERDAKKKELDELKERLGNFQKQYIQVTDELATWRKAGTDNIVKLGELELQKERDKQTIQKLQDDILKLQKTTGQLVLNAEKQP